MTRKGAFLDLLFVNRDGLVDEVVIGIWFCHRNDGIVELKISDDARKTFGTCYPGIWESRL